MQAKQAATAVVVSLALPIVLAAPAEAAPYLHLSNSAPSKLALASVPRTYLSWYQQAARTCRGLPWPVLAGIGEMESDHGKSTAPGVHSAANFAGAEGPMQFEPGTFAAFAVRADRSHALSPYDPQDAIYTAARMLCADGARGGSPSGISSALFAYNHADWYPPQVMGWASKYATDRIAVVRAPHRSSIEAHTVAPRRARRVIVAPHITAPHVIEAPHVVKAPHTAEAPHTAARHTATPKPTQTANPLAPTPAPTATPSVTPSGTPTATPSASAAQPAPSATAQPSQVTPTPTPSATQPVPTPSATTPATVPPAPSATQPSAPAPQPTPSQLSADAQQLAAEAQQLSAEARQLSNEAQQLSAEAQQLAGQHGAAPVTLVHGTSGSAQAEPAAPAASSSVPTSAGAPSAGTPGAPSAGTPSAAGPSPAGPSATTGPDQQ